MYLISQEEEKQDWLYSTEIKVVVQSSVMPLQLDTEKWITREGKRQDLL